MSGTSPEHNKAQSSTELNEALLPRQLLAAAASGGDSELLADAANRIERLERFVTLIGLLAPAGTAPRTALEQIYAQSAETDTEASQIVLDLRGMLAQHWADWTPALREAEGLPPIDADKEKGLPFDAQDDITRLQNIEEAATQLFIPVWRAIVAGNIPDRSRIDDAALQLRDALNPNWPSDSDWLPEPLATERAQGEI